MRKALSALLCAALSLALLAGCGPKAPAGSASAPGSSSAGQPDGSADGSGNTSEGYTAPHFMVLSGPTGVGAAWLMAHDAELDEGIPQADRQYPCTDSSDIDRPATSSIQVAADNQEIAAALVNGDADIAAMATNMAANLYAKTDGAIQVLAVNTLGVLYILEKGDSVQSLADLSGKTLYAPSNIKGANPEHILTYLLSRNGVDIADVDIQWIAPQEVAAKMTAGETGICMLPVPAATALLAKDSEIRQALSLSQAWDELGGGPLPMGCIVARTDYIQSDPEGVSAFLHYYQESIQYMSDPDGLEQAAQLAVQAQLVADQAIAQAAIPQCNLTFLTGREMRLALEEYYGVLFQVAPKSIGGGLPYDSFYYGVA